MKYNSSRFVLFVIGVFVSLTFLLANTEVNRVTFVVSQVDDIVQTTVIENYGCLRKEAHIEGVDKWQLIELPKVTLTEQEEHPCRSKVGKVIKPYLYISNVTYYPADLLVRTPPKINILDGVLGKKLNDILNSKIRGSISIDVITLSLFGEDFNCYGGDMEELKNTFLDKSGPNFKWIQDALQRTG